MLAWVAVAEAQRPDAEALFDDGVRLMKEGKVAEACQAFEASNRIEPRAGTLIRIGECREQNHQLASAWSAYKDALTRVKDPKKRGIAQDKVAALEPELSYLTITVSDAALDGLELTSNGEGFDRGLWNRPIPVDGGDYVIAAHAPHHRDWKATVSVPVDSGKVTITVPALAIEQVATPPAPPPPIAVVTALPAARSWTTRRELAVGTASVTVLAAISGVVLGELARSRQHDAERLCTPNVPCVDGAKAQASIDSARTRALEANIAFGVAGAAAIATGVLWLTGAPAREHHVAVMPSIGHGAASVVVSASL